MTSLRSWRMPPAGATDVVIIGAGHAGLAMSRFLSISGIDHVVLERAEVAHSWRRERWDSLRLLTPNWQSRLPDFRYSGTDPDGFMTMPEVVAFLESYARFVGAPVRGFTEVVSVSQEAAGYQVITTRGTWRCRAVVLASGAHSVPLVPKAGADLPQFIHTLTPKTYRSPSQLDPRRVLVVGASASGVQIADEIQRSGRQVTLAVGEHIRMPRTYRGRDILWWLAALGISDERYDAVADIVSARRVPSPQLVGTPERVSIDLNSLQDRGVEIVGRLVGVAEHVVQFSGSLPNHCAMADLKAQRLLKRIDSWIEAQGLTRETGEPQPWLPTRVDPGARLSLHLARDRIGSVIWATGSRPDYSWLHVPAFDRKGRLNHCGGRVDVPGLYVLGLNFMRRRKSSFIHGAEDDVREIGGHLLGHLGACTAQAERRLPGVH